MHNTKAFHQQPPLHLFQAGYLDLWKAIYTKTDGLSNSGRFVADLPAGQSALGTLGAPDVNGVVAAYK